MDALAHPASAPPCPSDPASAWRVTLQDGALRWQDEGQRVWAHEPESSAGLRALVWLLGWLPIDSQL